MTDLMVRVLSAQDQPLWNTLYAQIMPDSTTKGRADEIARILASDDRFGIVAEREGQALGLAELSIRPFANGCRSHPVPFLEAIWVDPNHRRAGIAQALLDWLEDFARDRGFDEIGSDVLQDNALGLAVHECLGFEETERVVYFRKAL